MHGATREWICVWVWGRKANKCAIAEGNNKKVQREVNCLELTRIIFYTREWTIQLRSMNLWLNLRLSANNIQFEPINKSVRNKSLRKRPSNPIQSKPTCVCLCYCDPKISVIVAAVIVWCFYLIFPVYLAYNRRISQWLVSMGLQLIRTHFHCLHYGDLAGWLAVWHPFHESKPNEIVNFPFYCFSWCVNTITRR